MAHDSTDIPDTGTKSCCETCGGVLRFEPDFVGETAGGLVLRGWNYCETCDDYQLSRRGVPHEQWRLARGGISVDTGALRIRVEGDDVEAKRELTARIVRLPELERLALHVSACQELDTEKVNAVARAIARVEGWDVPANLDMVAGAGDDHRDAGRHRRFVAMAEAALRVAL